MSTKELVAQVANDLRAGTSDLIALSAPPVESSKALHIVQSYISNHQPSAVTGPAPTTKALLTFHSSIEKLGPELVALYKATFPQIPTAAGESRKIYQLDPQTISNHDERLRIITAYLSRLLPIYDPAQMVEEWWELLIKPVLRFGRWKVLLNEVQSLALRILVGETWAVGGRSVSESLSGVVQFRELVLGAFLGERAHIWGKINEVGSPSILNPSESLAHSTAPVTEEVQEEVTPSALRHPPFGNFWDSAFSSQLLHLLTLFGVACPKPFFELLQLYAIRASQRVHVFSLLIHFGRRQESPLYYIYESKLFGTILTSCMQDTDTATVCAALMVLGMYLPSFSVRLADVIEQIIDILRRVVEWEVARVLTLNRAFSDANVGKLSPKRSDSPTPLSDQNESDDPAAGHPQKPAPSRALLHYLTPSAIQQVVENFYTLVYGAFPCTLGNYLKAYLRSKGKADTQTGITGTIKLDTTFEKVTDVFSDISTGPESDLDFPELAAARFKELASLHRVHPNLLLLSPEEERQQWRQTPQEPSDILIHSLELRTTSEFTADRTESQKGLEPVWVYGGKRKVTSKIASSLEGQTPYRFWMLNGGGVAKILKFGDSEDTVKEEGGNNTRRSIDVGQQDRTQTITREPLPSLPQDSFYPSQADQLSNSQELTDYVPSALPSSDLTVDVPLILETNRALRQALMNLKNPDITVARHSRSAPINIYPNQSVSQPDAMPAELALDFEIMKLHLLLLLNEVNFQSFLRRNHVQYIRKLKKERLQEDVREADRQTVFAKIKLQQTELCLLQETLNRHRHEYTSMRERQRKYEEDLTKRLKAAKEEAGAWKETVGRLQTAVEEEQEKSTSLQSQLADAEAQNFQLETEVAIAQPQLEKLNEYAMAVETLSKRVMAFDSGDVYSESWTSERDRLVDQVAGLDSQLMDADAEIASLKKDLSSLADEAADATLRVLQAESKVEVLERDMKEQVRTGQLFQLATTEKIKAVESRYDSVKRINTQLQARIIDLQSKSISTATSDSGNESENEEMLGPIRVGVYS